MFEWAKKLAWAALLVLHAGGCSMSPGGRFTLFPESSCLTTDARVIRRSTPAPIELSRELDKQVSGPYIVEPGDVLLVQPSSLDSPARLPGDQPILADGTIQLGRYGRYQAAGKPVEIIEREINDLISREVKDAGPILVRLVSRESKMFYVLGEVNAPGAYPLRGREAVLDAILAAGGLNSGASRRNIILTRPTSPDSCRVILPVRYNEIVQLGDTTTNYQIRAGDRIFVPSRSLYDDFLALVHLDEKEKRPPQFGCPPSLVSPSGKMVTTPTVVPTTTYPVPNTLPPSNPMLQPNMMPPSGQPLPPSNPMPPSGQPLPPSLQPYSPLPPGQPLSPSQQLYNPMPQGPPVAPTPTPTGPLVQYQYGREAPASPIVRTMGSVTPPKPAGPYATIEIPRPAARPLEPVQTPLFLPTPDLFKPLP